MLIIPVMIILLVAILFVQSTTILAALAQTSIAALKRCTATAAVEDLELSTANIACNVRRAFQVLVDPANTADISDYIVLVLLGAVRSLVLRLGLKRVVTYFASPSTLVKLLLTACAGLTCLTASDYYTTSIQKPCSCSHLPLLLLLVAVLD